MDKNWILFIDGECNLCNGLVRILSYLDHSHVLSYSSLSSDFAKFFFNYEYDSILRKNSVIFSKNETLYFKSEAVLELLTCLGFPFSSLTIFRFIPQSYRDKLYDYVAENRYMLFGKTSYCQLSSHKTDLRILQAPSDLPKT